MQRTTLSGSLRGSKRPRLRVAAAAKAQTGAGAVQFKMDQSRGVRFRVSGAGLQRAVLAGADPLSFRPRFRTQEDTLADLQSEYTLPDQSRWKCKTNLSAVQELCNELR